tara:strand:+ start:39 stop:536 length:498 start_codon:yes stop_codon:yes gene_type:complete
MGEVMEAQLEMFTRDTTLAEARTKLRDGVEEGIHCPCCDRWAQAYWRTINKTMARGLQWLAREADMQPGVYVDITKGPAWLLRSNQLASLRWWGLIRKAPNDDPKKKSSGMWALTHFGHLFISGKAGVPRRVCTLFGDVVDQENNKITVHDIKHHFDYMEVMRGE